MSLVIGYFRIGFTMVRISRFDCRCRKSFNIVHIVTLVIAMGLIAFINDFVVSEGMSGVSRPAFGCVSPGDVDNENRAAYLAESRELERQMWEAFDRQEWEIAYETCAKYLMHDNSLEQDRAGRLEILDQCRRRLWRGRRGIKLPSMQDWTRLQLELSRPRQLAFLVERIHLAKGTPASPVHFEPASITKIVFEINGGERVVRDQDPISDIDPFLELWLLKPTQDELRLLYSGLATDWILVPENWGIPSERIRKRARSRECLCVLINGIVRKTALSPESLSESDWQRPERIAEIVNTAIGETP